MNRIIIFGGLMKALHYLGENYGVEKGFSYGNIVIWPVQTVVVLLVSVFVFHEKVKIKAIAGAVFCILGIGLISWNGAPTGSFMEGQGHLLPAFIAAGAGAALFSVCQKRLLGEMGTVEMNMSMFFIGGLAAACTIPPTGAPAESIRLSAVLAVLALGAITGLGFLLQAEAFRTVPVFTATIIGLVNGDNASLIDRSFVSSLGNFAREGDHHCTYHSGHSIVPFRYFAGKSVLADLLRDLS